MAVEVHATAGALGAEISGVDLARADALHFEAVHEALLEHGVVFLRGQELSREGQLAFARRFGSPEVHPIANGMPVSRPAVSQHLRVLKHARLVSERAEGPRRIYAVDERGLRELRAYLDQFWDDALASFKASLEEGDTP